MKKETGITLLALVITITILLILAGITISAITGDNGIIGNAEQAKEETEIANEKEIVEKATVQAMGNNKYGNIEESELQSELDKEIGVGKTDATDIGDEFEVIFVDSNRYYIVDKDGNVEGEYPINDDKNPGNITIGENGEELDGSEEKPYEISCIEDLVVLSNISRGKGNCFGNRKEASIMAVWGKVEFSELTALRDRLERLQKTDFDAFCRAVTKDIAARLLRKTIQKTPVDTGELRRSWTVGTVEKRGDLYYIEVINPLEYAQYVEYGHRQTPGRYVPAIGKRLKRSWVQGKFMLTLSENEIQRDMDKIINSALLLKWKRKE